MLDAIITAMFLLTVTAACSSFPDPAVGLRVNFSAAAAGDGSECWPFRTLSEGLSAASAAANGTLLLTGEVGELTADFTVKSGIRIRGAPSTVRATAQIRIEGSGALTIDKLNLIVSVGEAFITCFGGMLTLIDSTLQGRSGAFVAVSGGLIEVRASTFEESLVFSLKDLPATLSVFDSEFDATEDIVEIDAFSGKALVAISNATARDCGAMIRAVGMSAGRTLVAMVDCRLVRTAAVAGVLNNTSFQARNLRADDITQPMVTGAILNSNLSFSDCFFQNINSPLFDLRSFSGELALINSTLIDILEGPIAVNTSLPMDSALVTVVGCSFANITLSDGNGAIFAGISVTFHIEYCTFSGVSAPVGGIIRITSGTVWLLNTLITELASNPALFAAVNSSVSLSNMSVCLSGSAISASCRMSSDCLLSNISVVGGSSDTDQAATELLIQSNSSLIVQNSVLRGLQCRETCIRALDAASVKVLNTTFIDIGSNALALVSQNGFMQVDNATLIEVRATVAFRCMEAAISLRRISAERENEISTLLYTYKGTVSLTDSLFLHTSFALVQSHESEVVLKSLTLQSHQGAICFNCVHSHLTVDGLHLTQSQAGELLDLSFSVAHISNFRGSDINVRTILHLERAQVSLTQAEIRTVETDSNGGLVTAVDSTLIVESAVIAGVTSRYSTALGLITLQNTPLQITNCTFSDFSGTLISAHQSFLNFTNSTFANSATTATAHSLGSVLYSDCSDATINKCVFRNLTATDGGVLFLKGSGRETCNISQSTANANSAKSRGGFVYSSLTLVTIKSCRISHHSADRGAVLYVQGSAGEVLTTAEFSQFANNSARLEGGVLFHHFCRYRFLTSCSFTNNTAAYGPVLASESAGLVVYNSRNNTFVENYTVTAASGQPLSDSIALAVIDTDKQVMKLDNYSVLRLSTTDEYSRIVSPTVTQSRNGIFTLSGITIIGRPLSLVTIVTEVSCYRQMLFTVWLRDCETGEILLDSECVRCANSTFSVNPLSKCKPCPAQADCPHGAVLSLHQGFWRPSASSEEIYQCLLRELCLGAEESKCTEGHIGLICSRCALYHYKVNQLQCLSCENKGIAVIKWILALALSINTAIFALSKNRNQGMIHLVIFDFFHSTRILLNFSIFWPKSIAFFFSAVGDVGSLGLSAVSDNCFSAIRELKSVYSELLLSTLYFFGICVTLLISSCVFQFFYRKIKFQVIVKFVLYMAYLMLPMLMLRMLQMFPCFVLAGEQHLLYDSSVKCWTPQHSLYTFALALPVFLAVLSVPFVLLLGTLQHARGLFVRMPKWQFYCLSVFLMRKYAITCLLLFANSLALPTQVGVVIAVNVSTEVALVKRRDCRLLFFLTLYQASLAASTLIAFLCGVYSTASSAEKDYAFTLANYFCFLLPAAFALCNCVYDRIWKQARYVMPVLGSSNLSRSSSLENSHISNAQMIRPPVLASGH